MLAEFAAVSCMPYLACTNSLHILDDQAFPQLCNRVPRLAGCAADVGCTADVDVHLQVLLDRYQAARHNVLVLGAIKQAEKSKSNTHRSNKGPLHCLLASCAALDTKIVPLAATMCCCQGRCDGMTPQMRTNLPG